MLDFIIVGKFYNFGESWILYLKMRTIPLTFQDFGKIVWQCMCVLGTQ